MKGPLQMPLRRIASPAYTGRLTPQLYVPRASTILPSSQGKDGAFRCISETGDHFHCKGDAHGRPERATEFFFQSLATRLGIRVADFAPVEYRNELWFGSLDIASSSGMFEVRDFLTTEHRDEIGARVATFPGEYLAQLLAFDIFANNPDRGLSNFLLTGDRRLCAIDFADADLRSLATESFPVASSNTLVVGRRLKAIHGRFDQAGIEMVDRIIALPNDAVDSILKDLPDEWMAPTEKKELRDDWHSEGLRIRLARLRLLLINESFA